MNNSELSRHIKPRALPANPLAIEADAAERTALAARVGVSAIPALHAELTFEQRGDTTVAEGTLRATFEQPCAVTGEDFAYSVEEQLHLRFVPLSAARTYAPDEEVELVAEDLDEVAYDGETIDIGEAIAQSLALAVDPYREGPGADAARAATGIVSDLDVAPNGPLAEAMRALKGD